MLSTIPARLPAAIWRYGLALVLVPWHAVATDAGYASLPVNDTPLTLHAEATARRFAAAHGRRGMIVGYAVEAMEGWVYPFRIFHDYRIGIRPEGASNAISGSALIREVIINPESVTRVYSGQNFSIKEILFVPLDAAGFAVLYQVESRLPLHIVVSFRPDLDLMWPGGIGGQSYEWDARRRAFVLQDSSGKYSALVGSPMAGGHSDPASYALPWVADRTLSLELDIPAGATGRTFPLVVSCRIPGHEDAGRTYDDLLGRIPALYQDAVQHYQQLVRSHLQVETPDREVNLAYAWARITLDQAYVCNPLLGCGLVAGYGPSRDTRRPQYAWFFGGDAMINSFALAGAGDNELARDAFRFIQKYQRKENGEIFHEISQSAGWINWFEDYPYAYRHTDASAMYLVAVYNFYLQSGDRDFLRSSWDSLRAAYQYLVSRIDPHDGLVTVPAGGWGGDETIGEQVTKDIYLESIWVAAANGMRQLASAMGDRQLASDAQARAEKARNSVESKLWNPERNFFFYGFNGKGQLLPQELGQVNWGMWLGVLDDRQSDLVLDQMSRARWETDWGLRSIPVGDPLYIGDSYGHGSVWPLGTGVQALAFYKHHRPLAGFPLWHSLIDQTFLNSLGHVTEVLSGDFYRELDVSVPEQIWSSGMVITALLRGVLGIEPNAPENELMWRPHLPPDWPGIKLRGLQVGGAMLNLEIKQSPTRVTLHVENSAQPVVMDFSPEIPLGTKNLSATMNGAKIPVSVEAAGQDVHARVSFQAARASDIVIAFEAGVRPWLPPPQLRIGDTSRGLRILSSGLKGRIYSANVEGVAEACSHLLLFTPWPIVRVGGGKTGSHRGDHWDLVVSSSPESCHEGGSYQTWTLQVEFAP
ncbi:MAG TPA: GH116 family glycosyl hydrolase [Terriglobia bacterium]|nr:GH116 family glycosyl hydrolase [Terriglobia bacterium]